MTDDHLLRKTYFDPTERPDERLRGSGEPEDTTGIDVGEAEGKCSSLGGLLQVVFVAIPDIP